MSVSHTFWTARKYTQAGQHSCLPTWSSVLSLVPRQAQCFLFSLISPLSWQQTPSPGRTQPSSQVSARAGVEHSQLLELYSLGAAAGAVSCAQDGQAEHSSPSQALLDSSCHLWGVKCLHTPMVFFLGAIPLCCRHVAMATDPRIVGMNNFSIRSIGNPSLGSLMQGQNRKLKRKFSPVTHVTLQGSACGPRYLCSHTEGTGDFWQAEPSLVSQLSLRTPSPRHTRLGSPSQVSFGFSLDPDLSDGAGWVWEHGSE
ncbi:uncharacterized protein LOC111935241 [Cyanistes caeruleus]|uniref:uncharacterized protein LOC111935241 n=1 Tax=Cyanistes caeruleus TaxID=156563 RepID=UPI000CDA341C|nr:uncharacterized protein LOC111935241 [Cyanistes caeruleus]